MSSNLRFVVDNLAKEASVSVVTGTEVASLPASNLTNYSKGRYSRVTPDTNVVKYRITLPSVNSVSAVILGPSNLTSLSTVQIDLIDQADQLVNTKTLTQVAPIIPFGTLQWGIDPLGAVFTNRFTIPAWFTSNFGGVKYIDITITDTGLTEVNLSYVYAGVAIQPARDPSRGIKLTYDDTNTTYRTEDGSLRTTSGVSFRKFDFDLKLIPEADRLILLRFINKKAPIVISLFQTDSSPNVTKMQETDYTAVVKSTNSFETSSPYFGYYDTTLTFEEI